MTHSVPSKQRFSVPCSKTYQPPETHQHCWHCKATGNMRERTNIQIYCDCSFQQQHNLDKLSKLLTRAIGSKQKCGSSTFRFEQQRSCSLCSSGDRVALISANCGPLLEAIIAILSLGAVAVPLNTRWTPQEVSAALHICAPVLMLVQQDLHGLLSDGLVAAKVSLFPDARNL